MEYFFAWRAQSWPETIAFVKTVDKSKIPTFRCFYIGTTYLIVKYEFSENGKLQTGGYTADLKSNFNNGTSVPIRFNPESPTESILKNQIDSQKKGAFVIFAFSLILGIFLLSFTRKLWNLN